MVACPEMIRLSSEYARALRLIGRESLTDKGLRHPRDACAEYRVARVGVRGQINLVPLREPLQNVLSMEIPMLPPRLRARFVIPET